MAPHKSRCWSLEFEGLVTLIGQLEKKRCCRHPLSEQQRQQSVYTKRKNNEGRSQRDHKSHQNSKSRQRQWEFAMEIFGAKKAPQMIDTIKRGTCLSFDELGKTSQSQPDSFLKPMKELVLSDKFTTAQNGLKIVMTEVGGAIAETF